MSSHFSSVVRDSHPNSHFGNRKAVVAAVKASPQTASVIYLSIFFDERFGEREQTPPPEAATRRGPGGCDGENNCIKIKSLPPQKYLMYIHTYVCSAVSRNWCDLENPQEKRKNGNSGGQRHMKKNKNFGGKGIKLHEQTILAIWSMYVERLEVFGREASA